MSCRPMRCLFCAEVVQYDPELSANLNAVGGCGGDPSKVHACADEVEQFDRGERIDRSMATLAPASPWIRTKYAALICWHHLYRWPELRETARQCRARGDIRSEQLWSHIADRATPAGMP